MGIGPITYPHILGALLHEADICSGSLDPQGDIQQCSRNPQLQTSLRLAKSRHAAVAQPGERRPKVRSNRHPVHLGFRINLPLLYRMDQRRRYGEWADKVLPGEIAEKQLICETGEGYSPSTGKDLSHSARQAIHHGNIIQIDIPVCTAGATDMRCRSNFDVTIEAAGRNLEQCAIHLDIRER